MRLLVPVCNVLRRERETEIKELAEHNMQFHNELTSYQRRQLAVSYTHLDVYKRQTIPVMLFLKRLTVRLPILPERMW